MIQVRLFATFRENRFKDKEMDFPDGACASELLKQLGIAAEEVGILLVNGRTAAVNAELHPDDVVSIFPALGGG